MLELDSALAQHIVERAMAILPHNVNVMDAQGMIIGSGDRERLHTRHEGAQLVLANQRVVEIDQQAAACLRGVKPGVNLPLMQGRRLIGVLGITGDPEQVRPYAELVRMAAEMLVEQRQLYAERDWQRHQRENWARHLLDERRSLEESVAEAQRLELPLDWPCQAYWLDLGPQAQASVLQARLMDQLGQRGAAGVCAVISLHELLWIRPVRGEPHATRLPELNKQGLARLCVSETVDNLADLRDACLALRDLQHYAQACRPEQTLWLLQEHRLAVLLHRQRHQWLFRRLLAPLHKLVERDENQQLLNTLSAWCEHEGQMQVCAQALGIHRNTLRYRLERIEQISGLDLGSMDQRLQLRLGLSLLPLA